MNKMMMAMALLLAMLVSQASAQTQKVASAAAPVPVLTSAGHAQLPVGASDETVVRQTPATVPAVRVPAQTPAISETNAGGLQALQWIYAAVTCHDTSSCNQHKNGVSLNFSMPY